jgi:hypothetical protein
MESDSVLAVGCLNNDRSVLAKSYAWRPLALLPILKGSASAETNDRIRHRRMELYHSSMDHIIADINALCSRDIDLRFAEDSKAAESERNDSSMRAWTSLSAVAVHHGWAKEPSDPTGESLSYTPLYTI